MQSEKNKDRFPDKYKDAAIAIIAIVTLYVFFNVVGIGCPIKFFTGISCFGCGMTRAVLSAAHLDFSTAFHFHPLWMVPGIWVISYMLRNKYPKLFFGVCVIAIVLFVGVYIFRMVSGTDDIVVFEPQNGYVFRGLKYIMYHM